MSTIKPHLVWIEKSPADARDAYAWFCSCGMGSDWKHDVDSVNSAAYVVASAGAHDHLGKQGLTSYAETGRTVPIDQWQALAEEEYEYPPDGRAPGRLAREANQDEV